MSQVVISKSQFQDCVPKSLKKSVTDELVDHVNSVIIDHPYAEQFRDNILGYASVMQEGRFKVTDYLNAIQYVSHKLLGSTNISAFSKTFPDKIAKWAAEGVSDKDISSYVYAYNKNKLVQLIFEQTLTPVHVLNMDIFQEAINTQAHLMRTAKSEKVRSDAANSLMIQLKAPETSKVELNINNPAAESAIAALEQTTAALIEQQKSMMSGSFMTAQQIAHSTIIEGEVDDEGH